MVSIQDFNMVSTEACIDSIELSNTIDLVLTTAPPTGPPNVMSHFHPFLRSLMLKIIFSCVTMEKGIMDASAIEYTFFQIAILVSRSSGAIEYNI